MNVEIVGIKDRGILSKERIVLKALSDLDIGFYMLLLTERLDKEAFESNSEDMFWFPNKKIKKGDIFVLYSKKGKESEKINPSGTISHFYYLEFDKSFFKNENKMAVVVEIKQWTAVL